MSKLERKNEYLLDQLKQSECGNLELGLEIYDLKKECNDYKKLILKCESLLKRIGDDLFDCEEILKTINEFKKEYDLEE